MDNSALRLQPQNNLFLIDWLTFVSHSDTVQSLEIMLGLYGKNIPWEEGSFFRHGYPMHKTWNGITISWGADDSRFYDDPAKARQDMGVCVNLSGQGCRSFETYGAGDWNVIMQHIFKPEGRYNVTRLDLAYDDHTGVLDIDQIESDVRSRYYVSKSKYAEIIWSDDLDDNVQGKNVQVGSNQSAIKIRIYDKASERGFTDGRHWIRCEIQLRKQRAYVAFCELYKQQHIGRVACGILRNYLTFRTPTADSNKSRWPIAPYWSNLLLDMERITLWVSPGEEYNWHKTESWLTGQCGQAILTAWKTHRFPDMLHQIERENPKLAPKYERVLHEYETMKNRRLRDETEDP